MLRPCAEWEIGLDRMLLETDSPYLAPVPMRGRRNESAFLPYIAAHIAESLGCTVTDVDSATTAAARRLFGLPWADVSAGHGLGPGCD